MPSTLDLIYAARKASGTYIDGNLAKLLGCSRRTVQRHTSTAGLSAEHHYGILIRACHPKNPELARALASARNTTLEALGLGPPPDPTRPEHADSVLCAAADALQLPPSAVRPALAAAFAKACEHPVTIAGLARHFAPPKPARKG